MINQLRSWQKACLQALNESFNNGKEHFFCLAATATGKTLMAAEFARRLVEKDEIDTVLVFCPSLEIQKGIQSTFSKQLQTAFDGGMHAAGRVMTYQAMLFQPEGFWEVLANHRTLIIFDEIHHCAGTQYSKTNSWGNQILNLIAGDARFILCLSGTPWRSDQLPITTALYHNNTKIQCDFNYGIKMAVEDGVCRVPNITLIDNAKINVTTKSLGKKTFDSIADALINSDLKYSDILHNLTAQRYILKSGIDKLNRFRAEDPNAGGLVVASSVTHAVQLAELLQYELKQSVLIVSYVHPNSSANIDQFKTSTTQWIVSVGMISEGTDIPRLKVCCFLSKILSEMNYRQVLGRILRKTKPASTTESAWMFSFAEPSLVHHAKQLGVDIPETVVNFENMDSVDVDYKQGHSSIAAYQNDYANENSHCELDINFDLNGMEEYLHSKPTAEIAVINLSETGSHILSSEARDEALKSFQMKEQHFFEELVELCDYEDIARG